MSEFSNPKEQKAFEALITANLHLFEHELEISDDEVEAFFREESQLSNEDSEALERLGDDPIPPASNWARETAARVHEAADAMHRDKNEPQLEPQTIEEINHKREEILARLRAKKDRD